MAEKPILCAGSVVRNILSGRQTQDRRPVRVPWGKRGKAPPFEPYYTDEDGVLMAADEAGDWHVFEKWARGPWSPGDVLYVRETWAFRADGPTVDVSYGADGARRRFCPPDHWRPPAAGMAGEGWVPSIHMPKWAARLHLTALTVTVERVNAISEDDAHAEGCETVAEFAALWDSLYGAGSFDRGDWCWVTRFEVRR